MYIVYGYRDTAKISTGFIHAAKEAIQQILLQLKLKQSWFYLNEVQNCLQKENVTDVLKCNAYKSILYTTKTE